MTTKIHIIFDFSGSMCEMAKGQIQKNLFQFIKELPILEKQKFLNIKFSFFIWNSTITELNDLQKNGMKLMIPNGKAKLEDLQIFLKKELTIVNKCSALLLTDGCFKNKDLFLNWKQQQKLNLKIRTVAIGADANKKNLKELSTNESLYISENIISAVDSICFSTDNEIPILKSIKQIHLTNASDEEDWDA